MKIKYLFEKTGCFTKDKVYPAIETIDNDIYAIDDDHESHCVAEGDLGGIKDEWFVEHFEIVEN